MSYHSNWRRMNLVTAKDTPCFGCKRPWKRAPTKDDNGCHAICFIYATYRIRNEKRNQERREAWIPSPTPGEDKREIR